MKKELQPILFTGIHRSDSTWIGTVISTSSEVNYVHEPFNLHLKRANTLGKLGIHTLRSPLTYWFENFDEDTNFKNMQEILNFITGFYDLSLKTIWHEFFKIRKPKDFNTFLQAMSDRKKRPLIKDPLALMASEFIAVELNAKVVITIRHPAAFIASIIQKNWRFDFNNFFGTGTIIGYTFI